jgi:hypothetical protein
VRRAVDCLLVLKPADEPGHSVLEAEFIVVSVTDALKPCGGSGGRRAKHAWTPDELVLLDPDRDLETTLLTNGRGDQLPSRHEHHGSNPEHPCR